MKVYLRLIGISSFIVSLENRETGEGINIKTFEICYNIFDVKFSAISYAKTLATFLGCETADETENK
jgi:hypothetical protein